MRKLIVAGNWKMHGTCASVTALIKDILKSAIDCNDIDIILFPSFLHLEQVHHLLAHSKIQLGAQNVNEHESGAFTGEISAAMLRDIGCRYVLVGHSERRHLFHESNALIAKKFEAVLAHEMTPILCLGETEQERESNQTESIIAAQLDAVIHAVGVERLNQAIISYEPVWAIGTGLTATPEQAQSVHQFIRQRIDTAILYGGSVKPDNAAALIAKPDIDGLLVGGASLDPNSFTEICHRIK